MHVSGRDFVLDNSISDINPLSPFPVTLKTAELSPKR